VLAELKIGEKPPNLKIKEGRTMAEKAKEKETKAVAPRRPFMDLSRWETDMERMMEDFFGRRTRPWWPERWFRTEGMEVTAPAVDLYEEKDDIVVKAELPGIDKDNYYRSERSYGSFVRTLELPKDVHTDKVKASFKNGILEVRLPKTEEAKAKEVKVKVD
jgi:HSP20 family protein